MQASLRLLKIELVKLARQIVIVLVEEQSRQKVWNDISVLSAQLVHNFLQNSKMRAMTALYKAVKQDDHLV